MRFCRAYVFWYNTGSKTGGKHYDNTLFYSVAEAAEGEAAFAYPESNKKESNMCCGRKIIWEIHPASTPDILKNCPNCGTGTRYRNTGQFRINANGNMLDIWLVYQCRKCKHTYNLTVYERIRPKKLNKEEYDRFLSNDVSLAVKVGLDPALFKKNKVIMDAESLVFTVVQKDMEAWDLNAGTTLIEICNSYGLRIRLDSLLAERLEKSRSKIKKWIMQNAISDGEGNVLKKEYVEKHMEVCYDESIINS